jgi:hypothetical protein
VNKNVPRWFVAKVEFHPTEFCVACFCLTPALLNTPAMGSFSATISATARRTLAGSARSHTTHTAESPRWSSSRFTSASLSGDRPTSTSVPCFASSSAVRCPMPEVGPVMMNACFVVSAMIRILGCLSGQSFLR